MRQPTTSRRARAGPSPARRTTARGAAQARKDGLRRRPRVRYRSRRRQRAASLPRPAGHLVVGPRDRRAVRAPQPHRQRRGRKPRGGQPGVRPRSCPPWGAPGPRKQWRRCGDFRARPRGGGPPQPRHGGAALARRRSVAFGSPTESAAGGVNDPLPGPKSDLPSAAAAGRGRRTVCPSKGEPHSLTSPSQDHYSPAP